MAFIWHSIYAPMLNCKIAHTLLKHLMTITPAPSFIFFFFDTWCVCWTGQGCLPLATNRTVPHEATHKHHFSQVCLLLFSLYPSWLISRFWQFSLDKIELVEFQLYLTELLGHTSHKAWKGILFGFCACFYLLMRKALRCPLQHLLSAYYGGTLYCKASVSVLLKVDVKPSVQE